MGERSGPLGRHGPTPGIHGTPQFCTVALGLFSLPMAFTTVGRSMA